MKVKDYKQYKNKNIMFNLVGTSEYVWQISFDIKLQMQSVMWHFWKQMNANLHFILESHLNFGLHNILGKLMLWIIIMQFWFVTKNNLSIKRKYLSVSYVSPTVEDGTQSIAQPSSPQRETRKRESRVFKFNMLLVMFSIYLSCNLKHSSCLASNKCLFNF